MNKLNKLTSYLIVVFFTVPLLLFLNDKYAEYVFENLYEEIVFEGDYFGSKNGTTIYLENTKNNSLRTIGSKEEFREFFDFVTRKISPPYKPILNIDKINIYKTYTEIFSRFSIDNKLYIYSLETKELISLKNNSPDLLSMYFKENITLADIDAIKNNKFNYISHLDEINKLAKNGFKIIYAPIDRDLRIEDEYFDFIIFSENEYFESKKNFNKIYSELNNILKIPEFESEVTTEMDSQSNEITYTSNLFGSKYKTNLYKSNNETSCLKIYHQGHGGDPTSFKYFNLLKNSWLENSCDVLDFTMIGYGRNNTEVNLPIGQDAFIALPPKLSKIHKNYKSFNYRNNEVSVSPLSMFTINQYFILKDIIDSNQYDNIDAVGISGGGLNIIFLSLLIPEIDNVISVNGSSPIDLDPYYDRGYDYGEIEYYLTDFYDEYSYWKIYFISSLMNKFNENRQLHMIYSVFDYCCFDSPDAIMLKNAMDFIEVENIFIYLNNSDKHEIFPDQIQEIESS